MTATPETIARIIEIASSLAKSVGGNGASFSSETAFNDVLDSFAIFDLIVELEHEFDVEIDIAVIPQDAPLNAVTFAQMVDSQR